MPLNNKKDKKIEEQELNSSNIFDEFDTNKTLVDEVEKLKTEYNKDLFYYLGIGSKVFQNLFLIILLVLCFLYFYIFIQNSETVKNKAYLEPICFILNWDVDNAPGDVSCGSVMATNAGYLTAINEQKIYQYEIIKNILPLVSKQDNFIKTKEVSFLLDKSENRIRVLDVLENFNTLKSNFTKTTGKSNIVCKNIEIDSDKKQLSMTCDAYYKWFDKWIVWYSGDSNSQEVYGTSVSLANSFLNYIEKKSENFTLVNRQKVFTLKEITPDNYGYTNVTNFKLTLEINF